ncbi:MAG: bifunctional phosphopantothenoylcysteine decarboxylase/phosphopantothenate--cysteine ligase CoaBC [Actinomycetes bacterium]|nr:bifunctional phosphopantothenoylcysteine decarboxylase/phosphopantothenate--cysteine ligase CoaBC [Actinomycetes bacterium]MDX5380176.1 bifunctional phosphopantothenoylcysteine decarboxylase/phosphopantothenate--cysteine ligase CoaBC [Actinomycetes bacterium]MDX5398840.1 bifunctional phosphopantothenoylcysteine decarboxylase/phosphopantothenate--cysteine ligase CoaBC [Actinomycetes bacterium]MDX5449894.1 bifunctional phosphopantothenoylcysteine decarboxylase/phosphopantothenate--cysteine liga
MARVVLGVTGGIAAYKSALLLRLLTADGHEVRVVPTANALRMVGEATWRALSGHPVHTTVWEDPTEHVELGQWADLVIVAPATAHFLAKAAHGLADDLLSTTLLMATCPVLVVPAMHTEMWRNPATRANVDVLRGRGILVMDPAVGRLTGPDSGPGRLPEPERIHARALALLGAGGPLRGARVVVTAGGTREPLDPVRFLGNRSSGRQGIEVARAAVTAGAEVHLIAANIEPGLLAGLEAAVTAVSTAAELESAVRVADGDVVVMAAAVADYRPAAAAGHKLKKAGDDGLVLTLEQTPDILAGLVARRRPGQVIVGFAAETGDDAGSARRHAEAKARRKGADLLVFNEVSETRGFGDVPNDVVILDAGGAEVARAAGTKAEVARAVVETVVGLRARLG